MSATTLSQLADFADQLGVAMCHAELGVPRQLARNERGQTYVWRLWRIQEFLWERYALSEERARWITSQAGALSCSGSDYYDAESVVAMCYCALRDVRLWAHKLSVNDAAQTVASFLVAAGRRGGVSAMEARDVLVGRLGSYVLRDNVNNRQLAEEVNRLLARA